VLNTPTELYALYVVLLRNNKNISLLEALKNFDPELVAFLSGQQT
jgi:hypothetical protein